MVASVYIVEQADMPISKEVQNSPDRSAAIVATSYAEDKLTVAVKSRLLKDSDITNKLFKPSGPMGGFAAKVELGYLLNIYTKETRADLLTMADIRNMFAHWTKTVDFGSREIRLKCETLTIRVRAWSHLPFYQGIEMPLNSKTARTVFLDCIGLAAAYLYHAAKFPHDNATKI
jgi:hypothetical protein